MKITNDNLIEKINQKFMPKNPIELSGSILTYRELG